MNRHTSIRIYISVEVFSSVKLLSLRLSAYQGTEPALQEKVRLASEIPLFTAVPEISSQSPKLK